MGDEVYFDGDPETESTRRHLERVLEGRPPARRWPWLLAALGGGAVWFLWRTGRDSARAHEASAEEATRTDG